MQVEIVPKGAEHAVLLHALVRKRAELTGQIEAHEKQLRRLSTQITNLDETIALFNPDVRIDRIRPKRSPRPYTAGYGMMTGSVIRALQEADAPLTSREIAYQYMDRADLDASDHSLVSLIARRVRACLKTLRAQDRVVSLEAVDGALIWQLKSARQEA